MLLYKQKASQSPIKRYEKEDFGPLSVKKTRPGDLLYHFIAQGILKYYKCTYTSLTINAHFEDVLKLTIFNVQKQFDKKGVLG